MPQDTRIETSFGDPAVLDRSLSDSVRGLTGSEILKIAADVRAMQREGRTVCNLTVGDFDARHFPIPEGLKRRIVEALDAGQTNYPPSDGVRDLREALVEHIERAHGLRYPLESILVASGARPLLYAAYRCVLNPGDRVIYPVPSWNNNHYAWISGGRAIEIATGADSGFMPTVEQIRPHLGDAQLLCLNTPLNPTGTVIDPELLRGVTVAVVEENERRAREDRRRLFLLIDQVYGALTFGGATHVHPVAIVPEAAPYVITLDAISKAFAATGLRVGWLFAPPPVTARFKDLIGHVGAWAPRPEQIAVAGFLRDHAEMDRFLSGMNESVLIRLRALSSGFDRMRDDGYPVDCIHPQGAIYLSLHLDLIGRTIAGRRLDSNDAIRHLLLERAGLAIVPFQAFGLREESGWFRLSVGAVSTREIEDAFPRLRQLLDQLE